MVEVHTERNPHERVVVRRGGAGRTVAILLVLALVVVGVLFATGFWKADVSGGDKRWPGWSEQGSALDKWIVCRFFARTADMGRHVG
ncbi:MULTISPECIES: hypothetical protein, partial [unclassified Sphingobium]|uniref:hypothetical protein n=1 Tax=unclassified Sphingobium TaxID=2611147 RepID=UPI001C1FCBA4